MAKKFSKLLSTLLLVATIGNFSGCELQLSTTRPTDDSSWSDHLDETEQYSSHDQVMSIANALETNTEILKQLTNGQAIVRLPHNNGSPISVSFAPNFPETSKESAIEVLDYLFGILGSINNNYSYEIVDYSSDKKSTIVFQDKDLATARGNTEYNGFYYTDSYFQECFVTGATVSVDHKHFDEYIHETYRQESIKYTLLHEMMHVLGFGDVYVEDTDSLIGTTILSNFYARNYNNMFKMHNITPDDFKGLIALYAESTGNLDADIEKYQKIAESYKLEYYTKWAADEFEALYVPLTTLSKNCTYKFSKGFFNYEMGGMVDINYALKVKDNKYTFTVTDSDGNVLETTTGKASFMSTTIDIDGTPKTISNAVMILENFNSVYFYLNKTELASIEKATSNMILYQISGTAIMKDTMDFNVVRTTEIQSHAAPVSEHSH